MVEKTKVKYILQKLAQEYPEATCALEYKTPEQLLFATILSAQCTDIMVNKVTKVLFVKYPDAETLANAKQAQVEKIIHSTGFYKNKAKNLIACAKNLVEKFQGKAPARIEDLVALPGVGRKTANVVLGNAYGIPGLVVDTHVKRLSNLLGLTEKEDPEKIEQDLMQIVPQEQWTMFSHWLISHGRAICIARKPKCRDCVVLKYCDYGQKGPLEEVLGNGKKIYGKNSTIL